MIHLRCRGCEEMVYFDDDMAGLPINCPRCGISNEIPGTKAAVRPPDVGVEEQTTNSIIQEALQNPKWVNSPSPPGQTGRKVAAVTIFLVTTATFFLPFGWIMATITGFHKGDSLCNYPGCTKPAEEKVGYQNPNYVVPASQPDEEVGFCKEHVKDASKTFISGKGKSFKGSIGFFLIAFPGAFYLLYIGFLFGVFREEPTAFARLLQLTAGFLLLSPLCYGWWIWLNPMVTF